jgi:hypothetical protein
LNASSKRKFPRSSRSSQLTEALISEKMLGKEAGEAKNIY